MDRAASTILMAALVLAGALMVWAILASLTATGPGCPGADPAWIGWCSEARWAV